MRRSRGGSPRRRFRDDSGVAETVGSVLLIGITVAMAVTVGLIVTTQFKASGTLKTDVQLDVESGDGTWGNGNELVVLNHLGGERIDRDAIVVSINIAGVVTQYEGANLCSAFDDDDRFSIGESCTFNNTIPVNTAVGVDVAVTTSGGGSLLLATADLTSATSACTLDVLAPTVANWTQTPPDLTTQWVGAVDVQVVLQDDCSGVDNDVDPHLYYRLASQANFVDAGEMVLTGANTWKLPVPDLGWTALLGDSLVYQVGVYQDKKGNGATTAAVTDAIENVVTPVSTYVDPPVKGTVAGFADAKVSGGNEATLTEGINTSVSAQPEILGSTASTSGASVTNPTRALALNEASPDASITKKNEWLQVGGFSAQTGTITKVEIAAKYRYVNDSGGGPYGNDEIMLECAVVCTTAASQNYALGFTYSTRYLDVTSSRTSWTWSEITQIGVKATYVANSAEDKVDLNVDALWIRVSTTTTTYLLNSEWRFALVPAGSSHDLLITYHVTGDTFAVQVWDGSNWNQRGSTLTSPAAGSLYSYTLQGGEYQGGSPKIRFVDLAPAGTTQGQLFVDYARVRSN